MDLADESKAISVAQILVEQNGEAMIVPVTMGKADPALVLAPKQNREEHPFIGKAHDASIFASRSFAVPQGVTSRALYTWLDDNRGGLIRAKGFAPDEVGAMQSVQLAGDTLTIVEVAANSKPGVALIGLRSNLATQKWLDMSNEDFMAALQETAFA